MGVDARTLEAQAAKAGAGRSGFFRSFLGSGPDADEAAELFASAAALYKLEGKHADAARCYQEAATLQKGQGDSCSQAKNLVEAGNCLKKTDLKAAVSLYEAAADIYVQSNRFNTAGRLMKNLAEEMESGNTGLGGVSHVGGAGSGCGSEAAALPFWELAAKYFAADEFAKTNFSQARLRIADLTARYTPGSLEGESAVSNKDLLAAITIYEEEAEKALANNLLKYNAKNYLLRAGILQLTRGDAITASVAAERYQKMDANFAASREGKLLRDLTKCYEEKNGPGFVDALTDYDRISPLHHWQVFFLTKIKDRIAPVEAGPSMVPIVPLRPSPLSPPEASPYAAEPRQIVQHEPTKVDGEQIDQDQGGESGAGRSAGTERPKDALSRGPEIDLT